MKFKGIIFDFNGVLLWDTHLHVKAWQDFSKAIRGFSFSSQEIDDHVHGRPNKYVMEYLLGRSVGPKECESLARKKESLYQHLCLKNAEDFKLSPGAEHLLDYLVKHNIPRTIATASDKFNIDFFIHQLELFRWFNVSKIVYENGTFPGKPAPDTYLKAAENLNLPAASCVVIEDSKTGLTAAYKAKAGKIIAIGPQETHGFLKTLDGVNEVIETLFQVEKEKLFNLKQI